MFFDIHANVLTKKNIFLEALRKRNDLQIPRALSDQDFRMKIMQAYFRFLDNIEKSPTDSPKRKIIAPIVIPPQTPKTVLKKKEEIMTVDTSLVNLRRLEHSPSKVISLESKERLREMHAKTEALLQKYEHLSMRSVEEASTALSTTSPSSGFSDSETESVGCQEVAIVSSEKEEDLSETLSEAGTVIVHEDTVSVQSEAETIPQSNPNLAKLLKVRDQMPTLESILHRRSTGFSFGRTANIFPAFPKI